MDVETAVAQLRAVRDFSSDPLRDDDLEAILNAGRLAGSSKNLQRWQFVVVRDRATLSRLADVGDWAGHLAGAAAGIAILTPDPRAPGAPLSVTWDAGRAAQNMMLVAHSRGIGSVPATVYDQELCRGVLAYPGDWHCEYILSFGHPRRGEPLERAPRRAGRRAASEVVRWERW